MNKLTGSSAVGVPLEGRNFGRKPGNHEARKRKRGKDAEEESNFDADEEDYADLQAIL
jgi:hypothetical protein